MDRDVCSVEDEEGGETYFRFRDAVGEKRRADAFANGVSFLAELLFTSRLLSLKSAVVFDERSSSG